MGGGARLLGWRQLLVEEDARRAAAAVPERTPIWAAEL